MLVVLHLARLSRLCRGRPRPCSRCLPATGAVFVFWSTYTKFLFVRIGTYQSGSTYTRNRVGQQVGLCHLVLRVGGSNPGWRFYVCAFFTVFFFVGAIYFVTCTICTMMIKVSSEQSNGQFYMRTECCRCCCCSCVLIHCCVVAAAAVLLLPAAVRHRVPDGQICCWFIEFDLSVFFLFIQTRFIFLCTPRQYCRIYALDMPTSSVITGMHGAKAGVSPPRRTPPCIVFVLYSMDTAGYTNTAVLVLAPYLRAATTYQVHIIPVAYCCNTWAPPINIRYDTRTLCAIIPIKSCELRWYR